MSKEALKLALRSLKELVPDDSDLGPALQGQRMRQKKAIAALREALAEQPAQPQQEPLFKKIIDQHPGLAEELKALDQQPQRTWVGLTHDEIMESWDEIRDGDWAPDFYAVIEAKLKEKNT